MQKGFNFLAAFLILGILAFLLVVGIYHTLDTVTAIETAQASMLTEAATLQSELTRISARLETLPPSPAPAKALQAPTTAPVWTTHKVTAYCACTRCCGAGAQGVTASGTKVKEGRTVAADPRVLPYGTVIEIEGVGLRTVEDCGAFRGLRLDLFFDSHTDALKWGVKNVRVRVVSYAR